MKKQAQFKANEELPFTLLSDEDREVINLYGVWVEKSLYGKKFWGVERSTFIISPDGIIERIFRKVRPKQHSAQILKALHELRATS